MSLPLGGPALQALKQTLVKMLEPLRGRLITQDRITEGALIANGGYSSVREAELREHAGSPTFEKVAVKKLVPDGEEQERIELVMAFARELRAWADTDHPNILPLIGFFLDADSAVAIFISPYMPHGSIRTYLRNANPNPAKRLDLAIDTSDGLAYLHQRNPPICHGDIKPNNVVINADLRAMICDFGLARVVQDHPSGLTTAGFDEAGTLPYQSPELVDRVPGTRRSIKSDTWAFGGVLLEVVTGEQPFKKCTTFSIFNKLKQGMLPASVDDLPVSARMQTVLQRCWASEPESRLDMSECSSELRLERAALSDSEDPAVGKATLTIPKEEPVPERLSQLLAALEPYRTSREIFKIDDSDDRDPVTVHGQFTSFRGAMQGAFRWAADGTAVAVSKISVRGERHERLLEAEKYARQVSIWAGSDYPHVVPLLGFFFDPDFGALWLISPQEEQGNLEDYILLTKPSRAERIRLAIEIAQGLLFLHAQSPAVVHGDVKARNVIVGSAGQAMITDFTSAVTRDSTSTGPTISHALPGSSNFAAPEVDGSHHLTSASDVWSFGCLLLEIFLDRKPYFIGLRPSREDHMPASVKTLSTLPEGFSQLMRDCCKFDADERPTTQQCIDVLTKLLEQEITNPSLVAPASSEAGGSASDDHSTLDAPDTDVGTRTTEALVVPEEVRPDQEEEAQQGESWCCMRCTIQ